jgi:tRNA (guanine-N7-)-methyltransferase
MRLKHVPGSRELIQSNQKLILDNQENHRIDLQSLFHNENPVHIEIGMGKGKFIYGMAKNNKDINYIGIEKYDSAIVYGLYKVLEEPLENLYLIRTDATDLTTLFSDDTIERIYLNFSDPWPKERHSKRRLTHKDFLKLYEKVMKKDSEIHFKTDNLDLFNFSLDSLDEYGMNITYMTNNLHEENVFNIMTEFEEKFSKKGIKINKLITNFKERDNG